MGLGDWVAKKWGKRKAREIVRQAFPGGVMSESLKKSLWKALREVLGVAGAAALTAAAIWASNPQAFAELVEAVPAAAILVPVIQMVARTYLDQRKHGKSKGAGAALVILGLLLASPAWAASRTYSNGAVAATDSNTAITFSDDAGAFNARGITVYIASSSDDEAYVSLRSTTATADTESLVVLPGGPALVVNWTEDMGREGLDGWAGIGIICDTGETATVSVNAVR